MAYIDLLKNILNLIYDPKINIIEITDQFFHKDYEQCINGVSMNRAEYIQHLLAQRQSMLIDFFNYQHVLEKGNELFAIYNPVGRNMSNFPLESEVIAYFRFESQKIFRIHGQVRLIKGDLSDIDMKSS